MQTEYDSLYRVIKLVTGEILFTTLVDQSELTVTFEYPIQVLHTISGVQYKAYCPYTESNLFTVSTIQVQHINMLSDDYISEYVKHAYNTNDWVESTSLVPIGVSVH